MKLRNAKRKGVIGGIVVFVILLSGFLVDSAFASSDNGAWFENIDLEIELSPEQKEALLEYAASRLSSGDRGVHDLDGLPDDTFRRALFVSVSDGEKPAVVGFGEGQGYQDAIDAALGALPERRPKPLWVKIDIIDGLHFRRNVKLTEPVVVQRGLQGIAFPACSSCVFLPETVVAKRILSDEGLLEIERFVREGGAPAEQFFRNVLDTRVADRVDFQTTSIFKGTSGFTELHRKAPVSRNATAAEFLAASRMAARYLAGMVERSGEFTYRYDPVRDKDLKGYNILRHAGTLYSMLEYYEAVQDEMVLKSAHRALKYLLGQIQPIERGGVEMACVVEGGQVKLGGNGLGALAIAKYMEVTGDMEPLPVLQRLCEWMVRVQDSSGRFVVHKQEFPDGPVSDFRSSYYPGEAIFGLMRTFEIDGDSRWLEAADAAAKYLITVRDKGRRDSQLPHDHWLLYGLNELYEHTGDPLFENHAFRISGAIMNAQNRNMALQDWDGGFGFRPRSTPAATRMEGLGAAYRLAIAAGMEETGKDILESLRSGNGFLLRTQIDPSLAMYLQNPPRSLGGVRKSLTDFEVRIDYVQHSLSSFLAMASILQEIP